MNILKKVLVLILMPLLCSCISLAGKLASTDPATVEAAVVQLVEKEPDSLAILNRTIAAAPQPRRERIFYALKKRYERKIEGQVEIEDFVDWVLPVNENRQPILQGENVVRYQVYSLSRCDLPLMFQETFGENSWLLSWYGNSFVERYRRRALPYLIEALSGNDTTGRAAALITIRAILTDPSDPEFTDFSMEDTAKKARENFRALFTSNNLLLQILAAGWLNGVADISELVAVGEKGLQSQDELTRLLAAQTLYFDLGLFRPMSVIVDLIRSEDWYIARWATMLAGSYYFDKSFFSEEDKDFLAGMVGGLNAIEAMSLLSRFDDLDKKHKRAIAHATRRLIQGDPSNNDRSRAAIFLGYLTEPEDFDFLIECLQDETEDSERIAANAASTLGVLGDKRAVPYLVKLIPRDDSVGWAAAHALGRIGDISAVPHLVSALENQLGTIAPWSLLFSALGELGDKRAIPVLQKTLKAEHMNTREYAVEALAQIKDPAIADILINVAKSDKEEYVRKIALNLAVEMGGAGVKALLLRTIDAERGEVLACALEGIERLCPERLHESTKKVLELHCDSPGYAAITAVEIAAKNNYADCIPLVAKVLDNATTYGLCSIVEALVQLRGKDAVPSIEKAHERLKNEAPYLVIELAKLAPEKYEGEVIALMKASKEYWLRWEIVGILLEKGRKESFAILDKELTGPHRRTLYDEGWSSACSALVKYFQGAPEYDYNAFWTEREKQYNAIRKFWLQKRDKFTWDPASRKFTVPPDNR